MGIFNDSQKRLNVYLKTAHKKHKMETLPDNKRKNVVKKIKKAVNMRWLRLHASVDGVCKEYVDLLETFGKLEYEGRSDGSMAKAFLKSLNSPKFIEMLYKLRVMLPSLTGLRRTFQTGTTNFLE